MEDTQKAVNLFNFIKGLNELKKQTITDINSQIWFLYISQLPEFENYVQFFDRNRSSRDTVVSFIKYCFYSFSKNWMIHSGVLCVTKEPISDHKLLRFTIGL